MKSPHSELNIWFSMLNIIFLLGIQIKQGLYYIIGNARNWQIPNQ